MCTSFVKKTKDNVYIGMNFDNNGMKYNINTKKKGWFVVYVEVENRQAPSFGVNESGIFINNLCVDSNEKGNYRRGKGVVHTARLMMGIINGKISVEYLGQFLVENEIVNVPGWSTHNMITTSEGNVWIIEPGRGRRYHELGSNDYQVMTNVPLLEEGADARGNCDRFRLAEDALKGQKEFSVSQSFKILKETAQTKGDWITDISMVFDKNAHTVYYCEHQDFETIMKYTMKEKERV